jgi:starch synthase
VPVVRAVGGLADTVFDATKAAAPGRQGPEGARNGFVFHDYGPEALLEALNRALAAYRDPSGWQALQQAGMAADHSWDRSAREYVKIYERAIALMGSRTGSVRPKPDARV